MNHQAIPRQKGCCYASFNNTRHTSGPRGCAGTVLPGRVSSFRRPPAVKYGKPALDNANLLALLQEKGLLVDQPIEAQRALDFIGYFRLRGYALPSMSATPSGRRFKPGTTFDTVLARYELDRELRRITHASAHRGKAEAFPIGSFLWDVERETHRSKDLFAQHYYNTYSEPLQRPAELLLPRSRNAAIFSSFRSPGRVASSITRSVQAPSRSRTC